ncbi:MAG: hypothetical protein ACREXR_21960, partial [Gammaproteobacteria bacterium]
TTHPHGHWYLDGLMATIRRINYIFVEASIMCVPAARTPNSGSGGRLLRHAILTVLAVGASVGCFLFNPCTDALMSESVSPDRQLVGRVYRRNCGATTPYVTHAVMDRGGDKPVVRTDRTFLVAQGWAPVQIVWVAARKCLVIPERPADMEVVSALSAVKLPETVKIDFSLWEAAARRRLARIIHE